MLIPSAIHIKAIRLVITLLACQLFIMVNTLPAQQCTPLLITGKKTLFQRIITQPGATLYASANDSAEVLQLNMTPFTVLYVYERTSVNGTEWLKVGPSSSCKDLGWIKSFKATDWKQS